MNGAMKRTQTSARVKKTSGARVKRTNKKMVILRKNKKNKNFKIRAN